MNQSLAPVDQAFKMAAALQANGKPYALHIYDRDGHSLPNNRDDRDRQIVEWFTSAK
jgi:dipeptidyl aminopeptidase/acylaminoacyl peptidase